MFEIEPGGLKQKENQQGKVAENSRVSGDRPSRVVISRVRPEVDGGSYPAKRFVDESVEVSVVLLVDGHDCLMSKIGVRHETDLFDKTNFISLIQKHDDEWVATFEPWKLGRYLISVQASIDRFRTWRDHFFKKLDAGQDVTAEIQYGIHLLDQWLANGERDLIEDERLVIIECQKRLKSFQLEQTSSGFQRFNHDRLHQVIDDPRLLRLSQKIFDPKSLTRFPRDLIIQVEPVISRFSSWYEFFPRSLHNNSHRHGTLSDASRHLDYVSRLGFDVVYLPPIHPIGHKNRKGKNNTLSSFPDDIGSPWAIGAATGGHKSIHPALGDFDDFRYLVDRANSRGLKIALDLAFQCSPDHPYVQEHPEWFVHRSDGSIQYAENPPKKYQDIYPFDFECEAWRDLWDELASVVFFWIEKGVSVFRVDNPHTKAFAFWEWLIREVRRSRPDVIFLAEAFTRPRVMEHLAKIGFSQSYTYFTWRNSKWELESFVREFVCGHLVDTFVPNLWPNTPDILPVALQSGLRSVFSQRLILAATLSSNYGIYGPAFELMEHQARSSEVEDSGVPCEEYLDSEKYQIRKWLLERPDSLAPLIERINEIRRTKVAMQNNRSLELLSIDNDSLLAFSKSAKRNDGSVERILVVVNLDPEHRQSGMLNLPLSQWDIGPERVIQVHDLLSDARYFWQGWRSYIELDPHIMPAHVFEMNFSSQGEQSFDSFN
jgi:starch synthase (maltosyl-transferring)